MDQSLGNIVLTAAVHDFLTLSKVLIGFAGNLGYVGGGILYGIGAGFEAFGTRTKELLGDMTDLSSPLKVILWPIKAVVWIVATVFEIAGIMVKNSFGLKPVTDLLTHCIREFRDWAVTGLNTTKIEKIDKNVTSQYRDNIHAAKELKEDLKEEPEIGIDVADTLSPQH